MNRVPTFAVADPRSTGALADCGVTEWDACPTTTAGTAVPLLCAASPLRSLTGLANRIGRCLLAMSACALTSAATGAPLPEKVSFNTHVRPILSNNCFYCHGPDEKHREAKLRLDIRENAVADLGGYAAIVPGKPDASELMKRITTDDEDDLMPPVKSKKKLTPEQKETLRRWIAQICPDSSCCRAGRAGRVAGRCCGAAGFCRRHIRACRCAIRAIPS